MSDDEAISPIKEILYSKIANLSEQTIQSAIAKDSKNLIRAILDDCIPKIADVGMNDAEGITSFAEGLLHYMLTNALIPSQRKIALREISVDIVIPDVRTLMSNSKGALILYFVRTDNVHAVRDDLSGINRIQPANENVWLVSRINHGLPYKTYVVDANANFADILDDIRGFMNANAHSKFRIFKVS